MEWFENKTTQLIALVSIVGTLLILLLHILIKV